MWRSGSRPRWASRACAPGRPKRTTEVALLAVDAGNTNVVLGAYEGSRLPATWRAATEANRTEDELALTIDALLAREDLGLQDLDALVLGSGVPTLTLSFTRPAERYLGPPAVLI